MYCALLISRNEKNIGVDTQISDVSGEGESVIASGSGSFMDG